MNCSYRSSGTVKSFLNDAVFTPVVLNLETSKHALKRLESQRMICRAQESALYSKIEHICARPHANPEAYFWPLSYYSLWRPGTQLPLLICNGALWQNASDLSARVCTISNLHSAISTSSTVHRSIRLRKVNNADVSRIQLRALALGTC